MLNELDKYDYTDAPISIPVRTGDLTPFTNFTTLPINNLQVTLNVSWDGTTNITKLQVTWDGNGTIGSSEIYHIVWFNDNGIPHTVKNITTPAYDIINPIAGMYTISVIAIHGITEIATVPVKIIYEHKIDGISTLLPPVNPSVVGSTTLTVTSEIIKLVWEYNTGNDTAIDKVVKYIVEVYDEIPTGLLNTYEVVALKDNNGCLTLPYTEIFTVFGSYPRRITFKIFSKDTFGHKSQTALQFTVENPAPDVQTFTLTALEKAIQVVIANSLDLTITGYNVYTSVVSGGTKTLVYSGKERFIIVPQTEVHPIEKYVTIEAYDLLGMTGLLSSPEQTIKALEVPAQSEDYVELGEILTIAVGYQLIVAEELFNSGEIINNNMVFII